ncbi:MULTISPECIES: M20/M25/M40 family metallo-hydrolase [unclassified Burkholderia]|uniref:M20/M25/M40 family metallo-hydrolase n=1 Tax=unclassified Burkholderia TaxID=2613784 RepID=UPI000F588F66|nr:MULTISPECIES: M20/M25/M40 family metallo-hydrolase [unclassified Burkholderia]RQR68747.1 M20/M25/M40 family metallo-hydrolase [Burkholderia sp. Bp9012]RQR70066.1 M20/M25/M40 family metallo-hydrolase [Burkholderia sp. Bp9011]RQR82980.1 M20/M25/M40 family metallo-hydrolase [Burkholderia sp. Bp9010]RQZ39410.1 M20/M25/M40 family metallo-hydrolase [Burkholderia sp. Bp9099]
MQLKAIGDRFREHLMCLGQIDEAGNEEARRLALSGLDKEGRTLVMGWMRDTGTIDRLDQMGDISGGAAGRNDSLPPIITCSHIDTQPSGGKFDGCCGVMAGLEVVQSLVDAGVKTEAPFEVAIWASGKAARFVPAMIRSAVFCGDIPLEHAWSAKDARGITVKGELDRFRDVCDQQIGQRHVGAYLEAHVEQVPVLDREDIVIGVVTGVVFVTAAGGAA